MENYQRRFGRKLMHIKNHMEELCIILRNYRRLLINLLYFLIYTILIAVSSLIITLPLWYAATKHSKGYTVTVILLIVGLTGLSLIRQLKQWIITKQKSGMGISKIILIPLKKIAVLTFFIFLLYGIVFLYSQGLLLIAVILTAIYILILGYYVFIYRKIKESI